MSISEEEISKWAIVCAFNSISKHVFLCIEVKWIYYIILTNKNIFCLM